MADTRKRLWSTEIGKKMIITDHYKLGERIGITLPTPAEEVIEIWEKVFNEYDKNILCMKDYHVTFRTMTGDVEYLLQTFSIERGYYRCILVEDRRDEI